MQVVQTNYTMKKECNTYTVFKDGKTVSKGFNTKQDALHSVWVKEDKVPSHFYEESNGEIFYEIV
jgi:hypothetical protein